MGNGRAFLEAPDGLRGRAPILIEWKGSHQPPGFDVLPADLRIDHVYIVSCKYLSRILANSSPTNLFVRRLADRTAGAEPISWYEVCAPDEYQHLYSCIRRYVGQSVLPATPQEMTGTRVSSSSTSSAARGCVRRVVQIHHTHPFSLGGDTNVDLGIPLCYGHHHLVHEGGWTAAYDPTTGVVTLTSPRRPAGREPAADASRLASCLDPALDAQQVLLPVERVVVGPRPDRGRASHRLVRVERRLQHALAAGERG